MFLILQVKLKLELIIKRKLVLVQLTTKPEVCSAEIHTATCSFSSILFRPCQTIQYVVSNC